MMDFNSESRKSSSPCIDITDENSFRAWTNLRKLSCDFGQQYFNKHVNNNVVNFWMGLVCLIGLWVSYAFDFGDSTSAKDEVKKAQFCLNVLIFLLFVMYFLNIALEIMLNNSLLNFKNMLSMY